MGASRISSEIDFERDGKCFGFLRLPHSVSRSGYGWIGLPIACIKNGAGPTVLLVGGNHGDEYEGPISIIKLLHHLAPSDVNGRIILFPAANLPALMAGERMSPLDGGNLNRTFPGNSEGGPTAMIAHYIESELLSRADYVLDIHSGGNSGRYIPAAFVGMPKDAGKRAQAIEMMRIFGAPLSILFNNPRQEDRTLTEGATQRAGVKLEMGTELGGGGTVTARTIGYAEKGIARLLYHFGVLTRSLCDEAPDSTRLVTVCGPQYYCYARVGGLFEPAVALGDEVTAGQLAGTVYFPDTPWQDTVPVRFERDGLIVFQRVSARIERGDCLFHLATDYSDT